MTTLPILPNKPNAYRIYLLVALAIIGWIIAYSIIQPLANWIAYSLLAQAQGSHLGDSLAFFFYDVPKIILLLGGMIFLISLLRTFFTAEQTRAVAGRQARRRGQCVGGDARYCYAVLLMLGSATLHRVC